MAEILREYLEAVQTRSWQNFTALLYEWEESAIASLSPDLETALNAPLERVDV